MTFVYLIAGVLCRHLSEEIMKSLFFSFLACFFLASLISAPAARASSGEGGRLSAGELPPPLVLAPAEIAQLRGVDHVTFIWHEVQGAASYHLVLATDRRFKHIVSEDPRVGGTSYTVRNLNYGTYFFKISSVSAEGAEGPFSKRLTFIVVSPRPADAGPASP
jgi:hypothetical protein